MNTTIVLHMPAATGRRYRLRERAVRFLRCTAAFLLGAEPCLCCGSASGAQPLCKACAQALFSFPPLVNNAARCRVCGKPLISEQELCMTCRRQPVLQHLTATFPLHQYRLWKKTLLHVWKSENRRSLSPLFAAVAYRALNEVFAAFGTAMPVVPIPPRPGKVRHTGWDQIAELCSHLRRGYGITLLPLLRRLSRTQQKKLTRSGRLHALGTTYTLSRHARRLQKLGVLPPAVVLIDDVLTTGATLETCAQVLKNAGVQCVYAITLFVVD